MSNFTDQIDRILDGLTLPSRRECIETLILAGYNPVTAQVQGGIYHRKFVAPRIAEKTAADEMRNQLKLQRARDAVKKIMSED
jgi:hypothetical protein